MGASLPGPRLAKPTRIFIEPKEFLMLQSRLLKFIGIMEIGRAKRKLGLNGLLKLGA